MLVFRIALLLVEPTQEVLEIGGSLAEENTALPEETKPVVVQFKYVSVCSPQLNPRGRG
jgi:hypothetical protein